MMFLFAFRNHLFLGRGVFSLFVYLGKKGVIEFLSTDYVYIMDLCVLMSEVADAKNRL